MQSPGLAPATLVLATCRQSSNGLQAGASAASADTGAVALSTTNTNLIGHCIVLSRLQQHGNMQRRGAAVHTHAMVRADKRCEILLKLRHVRAKAERAVVNSAFEGGVQLGTQGL